MWPSWDRDKERNSKIVKANKEGYSQHMIAKVLGISQPSVFGIINRNRGWNYCYHLVYTLMKIEFYAPKNPQHYLKNIYSFDFMELPPIDKRTIHAHSIKFK